MDNLWSRAQLPGTFCCTGHHGRLHSHKPCQHYDKTRGGEWAFSEAR